MVKRMMSIILLFSMISGLYGCTKQSPSDSVNLYLEQINKVDSQELKTLVSQSLDEQNIPMQDLDSYESTPKLLALMKNMTYTIN